MNALRFSLALLLTISLIKAKDPQVQDCSIIIESQWEDLDKNKEKAQATFGGTWILVGTITFKKKCNAQVNLQEIRLKWHGAHLDQMTGELFISKDCGPLKPINENHVADSQWGKSSQTLLLRFDHAISLHPTTVFHLVLTVPENQEQLLKGTFTIEPNYLPEVFQEAAQKEPLAINIEVSGSEVHQHPRS